MMGKERQINKAEDHGGYLVPVFRIFDDKMSARHKERGGE